MENGYWKTLSVSFDDALEQLPRALAAEGFGIVSQIDLAETIRTKLGKDLGRYRILGACNPTFAYEAITRVPHVGLALPCNVVLYEAPGGAVTLGVIDPMAAVGSEPVLKDLASEVTVRLTRVLAAMS
jgi:uncharacterized protein (DUF302 family)